jgi:hypothetical protein
MYSSNPKAILPRVAGRTTVKQKVADSNFNSAVFQSAPYLHSWALRVPGMECKSGNGFCSSVGSQIWLIGVVYHDGGGVE